MPKGSKKQIVKQSSPPITPGGADLQQDSGKRLDRLEEKVEQELKESQTKLLTVFGIFASFITFLTIEVQFLRYICDFYLVLGFSAFLVAVIILFSLFLKNIASDNDNWSLLLKPAFVISILFLVISGLLIWHSRPINTCENKSLEAELSVLRQEIEAQSSKNNNLYINLDKSDQKIPIK